MRDQMSARSPLLCPNCSEPLLRDEFECESCGSGLPLRHGIPSFGPAAEPNSDSALVERIADLTEAETISEATSRVTGNGPAGDGLLNRIYDTRSDAWRILLSDVIGGCCLDLYTGFGRRSLALAEITDTVYAVEPDLQKLRTLQYRDDFDARSSVVPVHADDRTLQLRYETFDTVIADYTGRGGRSLEPRLESLDATVKEGGSVVLFLDGWTRQFGVSKLLGVDESLPSFSERFSPLALTKVRRLLDSLGYDSITTYTLLPTPEQFLIGYKLGNSSGVQKLFDTILPSATEKPFIDDLVSGSHRLGVLDHLYPVYLVVGSKREDAISRRVLRSVVSTGRSRSIQFDYEDGELASVWKYPNRRRHGAFNEREQAIVEWLKSEEPQIRQTLPESELLDSNFGSVRKEHPVTTRSLLERLEASPESREAVLEIGLEWLLRLQRPETRTRVSLSPDEFVDRFSVPAAGIEPPRPSKPVTFFETPAHGDLTPENVYFDNGEVASVIDWEYGAKAANPVIDLGFFVTHCFKEDGEATSDVMVKLMTGCPSADPACEWIRWYADAVDIPLETILLLLPTVYVHRIGIDRDIGAASIYTSKERQRAAIVRGLWEKYETRSK